ncbi:MAG: hypothetical protein WBA13_01375 [Microcoleaceae cyanobacterium]
MKQQLLFSTPHPSLPSTASPASGAIQPTLATHKPPRKIPFYGIVSPAIMSCAEQRLSEVLDHFSNQVEAQSAKLWLKMACEFSQARSNTVQSIHWQNAPIATRFEVAVELEHQGDLIVGYLKKFKQYWNRAIDGVEDIETFMRSLPIPDYSSDAEIYHSVRRRELGESIYFLSQLEREFGQKLLVKRKRSSRSQ